MLQVDKNHNISAHCVGTTLKIHKIIRRSYHECVNLCAKTFPADMNSFVCACRSVGHTKRQNVHSSLTREYRVECQRLYWPRENVKYESAGSVVEFPKDRACVPTRELKACKRLRRGKDQIRIQRYGSRRAYRRADILEARGPYRRQ